MRHVDNEGGNIPTDYSGVISACDAGRLRWKLWGAKTVRKIFKCILYGGLEEYYESGG